MNKGFKKLSTILLSILLILFSFTKVNAATGKITVSSSTSKIVVGNTFTVKVTISSSTAMGSWEWIIDYDKNKFKLVSGETNVADFFESTNTKSKTYTYKFKATGTGSGKITVKSYGAIDMNEKNISLSVGNKTVTVITQAELEASYSKNNNLKSLSITGLTLSPKFSASTTEYTAEADSNTEEITIKATTEDSKADVSGIGTHNVSEGENKFEITVTAENGSTKKYTIKVNVKDPNPINVTINDEELTVVKRESNLTAPDGFEKTEIEINNIKVPAFYNELNNFTLVGLKNADGNCILYIYNKDKDTYEEYKEATLEEIKLYPLNIDKTFPEEYKKSKTTINNIDFESLKLDNSTYSIIHAKNLLTGEDNYYTYDSVTNTVIRYTDEATTSYKKLIDDYKMVILILGIESLVTIFILICVLISKIRNNKKSKKQYEQRKKEIEKNQKSKKDSDKNEELEKLYKKKNKKEVK